MVEARGERTSRTMKSIGAGGLGDRSPTWKSGDNYPLSGWTMCVHYSSGVVKVRGNAGKRRSWVHKITGERSQAPHSR